MSLAQYVAVLRRQWLVVLGCFAVLTASTIGAFELRTPRYQATASILLRPDDPGDRLSGRPDPGVFGPHVQIQAAVARSPAVAALAATKLPEPGRESSSRLLQHISVEADRENGILHVRASHPVPTRAAQLADAFSEAYIENRQQSQAQTISRIAAELNPKLEALLQEINDLNAVIGDGGLKGGVGAGEAFSAGGVPGSPQFVRYAAAARYQKLFEGQQRLLIEESLKEGGAQIFSTAATPLHPTGPSVTRSAVMAGFSGLLIGFALALLCDHFNRRLQSRQEVEDEAGAPVLGELPRDKEASRGLSNWVTVKRPTGAMAEATRALRTTLELRGVDRPFRTIVVTSPGEEDGKSFVAASLAAVYAQAGYTTVLVAADLRRPRLNAVFGCNRTTRGLTNVLAAPGMRPSRVAGAHLPAPGAVGPKRQALWVPPGDHADAATTADGNVHAGRTRIHSVRESLVPTDAGNLYFLPSGPLLANPADLLSSSGMTETLAELREVADVVILDTPPLLAVTDAAILAGNADAVLVVAALGGTRRGAVSEAEATLTETGVRLVGIVVNKVRNKRSRHFDYAKTEEKVPHARPASAAGVTVVASNGNSRRAIGGARRARS